MKKQQTKTNLEFKNAKEAMRRLFPDSKRQDIETPPNPSEHGKKLAEKLVDTLKKELSKN